MLHTPTRIAALLLFAGPALASPPATQRPANRLGKESSPYLLQHAHNPVDWFPWGPEAFAKAKKENKLIFLSIGYSACHWCHVMERESFANEDVAKLLNDSFVCIKVDREERPDIDQIYMTALQAFGQGGGWPLSMFLTPEGKPIIGGTYWPPEDKKIGEKTARGFKSILKLMLDLERDQPKQLREQADQIARMTSTALGRTTAPSIQGDLTRDLVTNGVAAVRAQFDPVHGGFGDKSREFRGTKFPLPPYLLLVLQEAREKKSDDLLGVVTTTLDHMARGGIYDQLGGGFHRYSTERTWTVPHFEKMLYDNAQLVEVYARAFAATHKPEYRRVVADTLEFVRRELTSPEGVFYSALDADSDGEEGRFYVWTNADIDAALPDRSENAAFRKAYGATGQPNFEEKWQILTAADAAASLAAARQKALAFRSKRPRPFLDTKVLSGWNGQMIAGYATAGQLLNEPAYVEAAVRAADFVLKTMCTSDRRLLRIYAAAPGEPAKARVPAYLDDYAFVVHGLLCLHDATGEGRWLDEAKSLTDTMITQFGDEKQGGFYYTASDAEALFARAKDQHDGAQSSGNSVAVQNLLKLAAKTGDDRYRTLAAKTLRAFRAVIDNNPQGLTTMVAALDTYLETEPPQKPQAQKGEVVQAGGAVKKSDSLVKAKAEAEKIGADGKQTIKITLTVEKGWHIYANPVGNPDQESAATTVTITGKVNPKDVKIDYPKGKLVKDMLVGNYIVYEGEVVIKAVVERAKGDTGPLHVSVKLQACNESTCLLPATIKLSVP
jgi:uncharacterized protein YyaL (SSP411 family)